MEYLLAPHECDQPYSVSAVNRAVADMFADGSSVVWVEGEVSGYRKHSSGHSYFSLKDAQSQISAVIWKGNSYRQSEALQEGMHITAIAQLRVYERGGTYQLDIQRFMPAGEGALFIKLEELKKKLAEEGLFSLDRKRPLPATIKRVGVVTAKTGAALQDILRVLSRNAPLIDVVLAPAIVQGAQASRSIVAALELLNEQASVDVIICGRGGGSAEDLACFNAEEVVRAVVASKIPVIAAVGHEIDTTLIDFAADLRAPTPSSAAEMVAHAQVVRISRLKELRQRFRLLVKVRLQNPVEQMKRAQKSVLFRRVSTLIRDSRTELDQKQLRLRTLFKHHLLRPRQRLAELSTLLEAKSPLALLARGYSVVTQEGQVVRSIQGLKPHTTIEVEVADGKIFADVLRTEEIAIKEGRNYFDTDKGD